MLTFPDPETQFQSSSRPTEWANPSLYSTPLAPNKSAEAVYYYWTTDSYIAYADNRYVFHLQVDEEITNRLSDEVTMNYGTKIDSTTNQNIDNLQIRVSSIWNLSKA